jgi:hypothetical protein
VEVVAPSLAKGIFAQHPSTCNGEPFINYIMVNVFGDRGAMSGMDPKVLYGSIHAVLNLLMREDFVSRAMKETVRRIEESTPDLVSFSQSIVDQNPWERAANAVVVDGDQSSAAVEASLFPLIRNFVGYIATPALMGSAFMEYYPTVCQDLWDFDRAFMLLALGLPRWVPIPRLSKAYAARQRLVNGVAEFHRALAATAEGKDPGFHWRDMGDVSETMRGRAKAFREAGLKPEESGPGDLAVLWA